MADNFINKAVIKDCKISKLLKNDIFERYIKDINSIEKIKKDELQDIIQKSQNGCKHSRNKIVEQNLKLSIFFCNRFFGVEKYNNDLGDIIQEANIGLINAIDKYDKNKGEISTYAQTWILNHIQRSNIGGSGIRIPMHIQEARAKYNKIIEDCNKNNTPISDDYIISKLNISKKIYAYITGDLFSFTKSIDDKINDGDGNFSDILKDNSYYETYGTQIQKYISKLTPIERSVISLRYGFLGDNKTLSECSDFLFISRERVRQIEINSLKKIKKMLNKNGITKKEDMEDITCYS